MGLKLGQLIGDDEYQIKKKKSPYFSGVMARRKFGHFKLVSKISRKLFELGS